MKKLVIAALMSMFSLVCMAGNDHTITINNRSGERVNVSDRDSNSIFVDSGKTASLTVKLNTPHRQFFSLGSRPPVTTITVTDEKENKNTIEINNKTKSITVNKDLELSKSEDA